VRKITNNQLSVIDYRHHSRGAVLLVVLIIVMTATILSLGFLSRSDVELACGQNMLLRTQMDYLAGSALEHAKGLILNPQDVDSQYWSGSVDQQLVAGSDDYYDIEVVRIDSDPTNRCNYNITCDAYRLKNGEKVGRSSLDAELRLDPCVALWLGAAQILSSAVTISGDIFCDGNLSNNANINGDVFAGGSITNAGTITGRQNQAVSQAPVQWPRVTVGDFTSHYSVRSIDTNSLSELTLGPYDPVRVCYRNGDLELAGNVRIYGMLVVNGGLRIRDTANIITAAKNLPALLVTGELIIENGAGLDVNGLAVVDGQVQAAAGSVLDILGGLFVDNGITGAGNITITAAPAKAAVVVWSQAGPLQYWSQAAGAFYKSIERK